MKVLIYSLDDLIIDDHMEKTGFTKGWEVIVSSFQQVIIELKKITLQM